MGQKLKKTLWIGGSVALFLLVSFVALISIQEAPNETLLREIDQIVAYYGFEDKRIDVLSGGSVSIDNGPIFIRYDTLSNAELSDIKERLKEACPNRIVRWDGTIPKKPYRYVITMSDYHADIKVTLVNNPDRKSQIEGDIRYLTTLHIERREVSGVWEKFQRLMPW